MKSLTSIILIFCILFSSVQGDQTSGCGNAICEPELGEDYGTCKIDCKTPKRLEVLIVQPVSNTEYSRGDKVIVQAKINADSLQNAVAHQMIVTTKTGILDLFDDGKHDDGRSGDRLYGTSFFIGSEYQQQTYRLPISATVEQTTNTAVVEYQVTPFLAVNFGTDKPQYTLGDQIQVQGLVTKRQKPQQTDVNIEIIFDEETLFSDAIPTDDLGRFDLNYQTTTIHPEGIWTLKIRVRDENQNQGFYEKKIGVFKNNPESALKINYLTQTNESHKTGEQLIIEVEVLDGHNEKVEGALVTIVPPLATQKEQVLQPTSNNTYATLYKIPYDLNIGQQRFELRATKQFSDSHQSTTLPVIYKIEKSPLLVILIEPYKTQYQAGETIPIKAKITYPDNQPLSRAIVSALINGQSIDLSANDQGIYTGQFFVGSDQNETISLSLVAKDQFENSGETRLNLFVKGKALSFILSENAAIVGLFTILIVVGGTILIRHIRQSKSLQRREQQKSVLEKAREELQKRYYVSKLITRETYDKERVQLEARLEKNQNEIQKLQQQKEQTK